MKHLSFILCGIVAGVLLSCGEKTPTKPADPTELEGTWRGRNSDEIDLRFWTYVMKRDSIRISVDSALEYRGTFTVDTLADPKTIDIKVIWSSNQSYIGKSILGVYSLSVNILLMSANAPGTPRPADIYTGPTIDLTLIK